MVTGTNSSSKLKETERIVDSQRSKETDDERIQLLYSAWSSLLTESASTENEHGLKLGLNRSSVPNAPHLENCKSKAQLNERFDKRVGTETYPAWTSWKGVLEMHPAAASNERLSRFRHEATSQGAYPPWVCLMLKSHAIYVCVCVCHLNY